MFAALVIFLLVGMLVIFLFSVMFKTMILVAFGWGNFWFSLYNSLFMNLISGGLFLLLATKTNFLHNIGAPIIWILLLSISILIDGSYLQFIVKGIPRLAWRSAVTANFVSHTILFVFWIFTLMQ
jgi:hypothetical protein